MDILIGIAIALGVILLALGIGLAWGALLQWGFYKFEHWNDVRKGRHPYMGWPGYTGSLIEDKN